MKLHLVLGLVTTLCITTVVPVMAEKPAKPSEELRDKVLQYLERPDDTLLKYYAEIASIEFIINADSELVVTSVSCDNDKLEKYIKTKLSNRNVRVKGVELHKPYFLRVTFLKE